MHYTVQDWLRNITAKSLRVSRARGDEAKVKVTVGGVEEPATASLPKIASKRCFRCGSQQYWSKESPQKKLPAVTLGETGCKFTCNRHRES